MLTPRDQRALAEGVKRGDAEPTERLIQAFRPLLRSTLRKIAFIYQGTEEYEDLAQELVGWTIELTREWDPAIRDLDGYLKEYLRYRLLDHMARLQQQAGSLGADEEGKEAVIPHQIGADEIVEEQASDEDLSSAFADAAGAEAVLSEIRRELDDPYLRAMFELKLQGLDSPEIADRLGVDPRTVRNDWSRRILKPIAYRVFERHGIVVKE